MLNDRHISLLKNDNLINQFILIISFYFLTTKFYKNEKDIHTGLFEKIGSFISWFFTNYGNNLSGCKKPIDKPNEENCNSSPADKIAGFYKGTGKYLPGGISLGNTIICSPTSKDYNTYYQTGDAAINITKLTDSNQ